MAFSRDRACSKTGLLTFCVRHHGLEFEGFLCCTLLHYIELFPFLFRTKFCVCPWLGLSYQKCSRPTPYFLCYTFKLTTQQRLPNKTGINGPFNVSKSLRLMTIMNFSLFDIALHPLPRIMFILTALQSNKGWNWICNLSMWGYSTDLVQYYLTKGFQNYFIFPFPKLFRNYFMREYFVCLSYSG